MEAPSLKDKVAIVTASTAGIGLAIARKLAAAGAHVVISSRKADNVEFTVDELKKQGLLASGVVCHVGIASDRKKLVDTTLEKFGRIDILVSNAAVNPVFCPLLEVDEASWDKIFGINVKSAFLLSAEVARHMAKRKSGSIVMISSIAAYNSFPKLGAYSASKTSLLAFMRVAASEWAKLGIRVNAVAPGIIPTKFSEALWKNQKAASMMLAQVPSGRFGSPEEIAEAVLFLASDKSSYIIGETIVVAGGMPSRL